MAKNFGTRLPENREGGTPTPQNTTYSGPVADKTRYDWDEHEMSATPDEMAAPEGMPARRRQPTTGRGPNMTRRIAVGVGGLALVGGAIFAMSQFGILDGILKPKEEEAPKEPEPTKLPDKLSPGDYIVGTDMEPGLWIASNFSTNDKSGSYMSIRRGEEEFDLKMPQDRQSATQWAGQAVMLDLKANDEVHTTGSLVAYGVTDMPKRLLSDIPNLRAGLLAVGGDLAAGKWQVTPKKIAEEINLDTYESVYQDVNYYGRLTQILARIAKSQSMTEEDILHTLCGYITLTKEDVDALHSPYLLADIPYMSDEVEEGDPYATPKVPILDKNGKAVNASTTESNSKTTETEKKTETKDTPAQPANPSQPATPEQPANPETPTAPSETQPNDPFNAATYHMASETTPNDPFGGSETSSSTTAPTENQKQKTPESTNNSSSATQTEQKPTTEGQTGHDAFGQTPENQTTGANTTEKDKTTEKKTSDENKDATKTGTLEDPTLTTPQIVAAMLTNANMMTHVIEQKEIELQDDTFVLPLLVDMQTTQKTA